ncbi:MAG: APC family permease [Sphingomonas sp.]|nr:APC family permease [Sphingomonas sp.]
MKDDERTGLRRDIGFTGSAFLSFNGIVGAGIFALPATLHLQFGNFSPWLFPIFGLLVLIFALPFARLASLFSGTGGPVLYAAPFGPLVAFQTGWLYYLAKVTSLAANAHVFATYAAWLWAPLGGPVGRIVTVVVLIASLASINVAGIRRAIQAIDIMTLLKALPLLALAIWGLASAPSLPAPGPPPAFSAIEAAALLILYAFIGFENGVVPAGETRDPGRTIPRAMIGTIVATVMLYFVVQLAYVSVMPAGGEPDAPLAAFAEILIGPAGAILLALIAMMSVAGNLTGNLASSPRVTFAMAEGGMLPRWFGAISARYATPANSIMFLAAVAIALAVSGSFVWLAVVSTLARMIVYAVSIAALPAAQRRCGVAGGAGMMILMVAGLAVCGWVALQSAWTSWAMLGGLLALGLVLSLIARRQAGSSSAG